MLLYLQGPGAEKRSAERDRFSAKRLTDAFSGRDLAAIRPADVAAYIEQRRQAGAEPGTINRELGLLSAALNWARRDLEWDIPNPVQGRRLREPEGRVRWLRRNEAEQLIQAAETERQAPHLADFIRLALHTGMRRGELLGLTWDRVDLDAGLVRLDAAHTKTARRRSVPINRAARAALATRLSWRDANCKEAPWVFCRIRKGKPERIANIKRAFASACRRAGIEDFTPHDLRHTCAAWLVSAGVPLTEVRDLLGHSTIRMTERYAHLAPERVRAAVEILDAAPTEDMRGLRLP
jgi:integrase